MESGTEFFAAETGRQNGLIHADCRSRDRALPYTTTECARWRRSGSNCLLPTQSSKQSPNLEPGTEFFAAEQGGEMGSFGSIARAEIALTRDFGRHVFENAALLRVSHSLYNYRVWVVGADREPVTPC